MNQLMNWRPRFDSLLPRNFLEDWMKDAFEGGRLSSFLEEARYPHANVAETENEYCITLELPGMDRADVEVKLTGDHLVVSGERRQEHKEEDKQYHRIECTYGSFERTFLLPAGLKKDPEGIVATFDKGMLEIRVPKVEPQPVTKIPVHGSE